MSKLDKLVGKGKEIEIGGIHIDIKPLSVSSLPLLMQIGDESDKEAQAKAMMEVVSRTLKDGVPDATEEEIQNISLEHITKLMEAIMEVNQLDIDKEFLKKVEAKRNVGNPEKTRN